MPKGSPFTALCRQTARGGPRRADLHAHTTRSDGAFTPSQLVVLAKEVGLAAVAVTDHDTLAGVAEAVETAAGLRGWFVPEVVPGVEITAEFDGREVHLLGLFVDPANATLDAALAPVRESRRARFRDFVRRLAADGHVIPEHLVAAREAVAPSLGRRHVADLLVAARRAKTRHEAFGRLVAPLGGQVVPKVRVPVAEAIGLVHGAGGLASLAHPPAEFGDDEFGRLKAAGLDALEAEYPWGRNSATARLRDLAARFGLAVTGGSDCHGPDPAHRRVGSCGLSEEEFARLRAGRVVTVAPG
jgi:predicted metal-dependent phosphoesterase TrpH